MLKLEIVYILIFHAKFEVQCLCYAYSTSQFGLASFQVLNSCIWLVHVVLHGVALDTVTHFFLHSMLNDL